MARWKWWKEKDEDVISYWLRLMKGEVTGNLKRKH